MIGSRFCNRRLKFAFGTEGGYIPFMDSLDVNLLDDSEDSVAVRIPKAWVRDARSAHLERHGGMIVLTTRPATLEDVASACADWGGEFPDRLPQSGSGVRVEL